ncbi:unnamed protein product [Amoebophrya sp. A120]|nr:unnamed protein product [Amoebophrya sp. A120]|eukprot:GSA120T00007105001.1
MILTLRSLLKRPAVLVVAAELFILFLWAVLVSFAFLDMMATEDSSAAGGRSEGRKHEKTSYEGSPITDPQGHEMIVNLQIQEPQPAATDAVDQIFLPTNMWSVIAEAVRRTWSGLHYDYVASEASGVACSGSTALERTLLNKT